jgi:SAM-dependent methyltransferase
VTSVRKRLGAWYTPPDLVSLVVDHVVTAEFVRIRSGTGRAVRVLDPACGDGRFLAAVERRVRAVGAECELVGVDLDPDAVSTARRNVPAAHIVHADALTHDFASERFDLVIGNPPYLSQMASATTRGGASSRSGGPYADAAVEFLALAGEVVEPDGGRVALVLPQSILAARDGHRVRASFDARARMVWSWWTGERVFEAQVHTCALAFEFGVVASPAPGRVPGNWSSVVTTRRAVPSLPALAVSGRLGDRATLNANFRDEYYGMVPAVGDHAAGPPLITSGLIDPGHSRWGERPVTFAKQRLAAPRIDLAALDPKMRRWAAKRLVPKVLVANQTAIIEAVCDERGDFLPAVPVIAVYPLSGETLFETGSLAAVGADADGDEIDLVWRIAAVLTSPVASAWAWHRQAGTGLSAGTIRLGPVLLGELPWPAGELDTAVHALRAGDVRGCGSAVLDAYALESIVERDALLTWWLTAVERIDRRVHATT